MNAAPAQAYAAAISGADYGEAYLEETVWTSACLEDGRVQDVAAGSDRGLGLRLLRKTGSRVETFFGSDPDMRPESAERLRAGLLPPGRKRVVHFSSHVLKSVTPRIDPTCVPLERKVTLLRALDRMVRGPNAFDGGDP
mgnify:FL=1